MDRYTQCGFCSAEWCDCDCSACRGEIVWRCVMCGGKLTRGGKTERGGTIWNCSCTRSDLLGECHECSRPVPARGLLATANGLYCSATCAGKAAIAATEQKPCPVCGKATASPHYDDTCFEWCQAQAQQGVAR